VLEELERVLLDIECNRVHAFTVKQISKVLKANDDLITAFRERKEFEGVTGSNLVCHGLKIFNGVFLWLFLLKSRRIEILDRLICEKLGFALDRSLTSKVSEGDEIFRVDCDSSAICLSLVKTFVYSSIVIMKEASVLHKFYCAGL